MTRQMTLVGFMQAGNVTVYSGSWRYPSADLGFLTMGYYTRADIPFQFALAEAFTLCDGYHCSVLGPTRPNRLYWMTGSIDGEGKQEADK